MTYRSVPFFILIVALLFTGCATEPEPVVVVIEEPEPDPEPVERVDEPQPQSEPEIAEPEPEPEPEPELEPEAVQPQPEEPVAPIDVPAEIYNQAFSEVEAIIQELNQIIYRGEFETWKTYLTERYLEFHSHPDVLAEISRQPILAQSGIRLRSLKDYFEDVVIPSRARARLDDLIFYSDTLVEAVTEFRGQRVILYLLRKIDGQWKIDTQETLPPEQASAEEG